MNAEGIRLTEETITTSIKLYATVHQLSEVEAMAAYFTVNPKSYALWDSAQKSRQRLGRAAAQANAERAPQRAVSLAETAIDAKAAELQLKDPSLRRPDALSKACAENPSLYKAYDRAAKRTL